ncbi:zinc transporter zip1 [Anaeramoeba flamelloides]|uniref:Zinc transporter zip1 n=1 Tax=Anaeramoeba flamelloides TaxID=1746091 RepID=A0AAV7YU82_9EUKA|nr:zinc transporter zip1 [Anaeramoeba flamelloides]KAJ6233753.1 zinc transporter zip1 [Anaeramoeba flamelloides]
MNSLLLVKIIATILAFALGLIGGLLPIKLHQYSPFKVQIGEAMAGGIFLGGGLVHMLSDSQYGMFEKKIQFPFPAVLCGVGFYFTIFLEVILTPKLLKMVAKKESKKGTKLNQESSLESSTESSSQNEIINEDKHDATNERKVLVSDTKGEETLGHHHNQISEYLNSKTSSKALPIILVTALCFHAVLEGLALGACRQVNESISITIAELAHKPFASFAIGAATYRAYSPKLLVIFIFLFSLGSPLGIFLGMLAATFGSSMVSLVIISLAAGTFLFAGTLEAKEVLNGDRDWIKYIVTLMGFALMSIVAIWN